MTFFLNNLTVQNRNNEDMRRKGRRAIDLDHLLTMSMDGGILYN